ncbi:MAG: PKD-like domain-containing protein [Bacteroidales bacterium]
MYKYSVILIFSICLSSITYGSDYYWVGGSGDFSDLSHWATTSGGNTTYTIVPTAEDNVFFDANSFDGPGQTVTISSEAVCRDMNWTGANWPNIAGSYNSSLRIFGSFILTDHMINSFFGFINFQSPITGNSISMNGLSFRNNVIFSGVGGEWNINGSLIFDEGATLYLEAGTLNLQGNLLYTGYFYSTTTNVRNLIIDSSQVCIKNKLIFSTENFTLSSSNSQILISGINPVFQPGDSLHFYNVIFTDQTSSEIHFSGNCHFNKAIFSADAIIEGNNSFDSLVLAPGHSFTLGTGNTQKIISHISLEGTCLNKITLQSSLNGHNSTLLKDNGTVIGEYLSLSDIHVSGGSLFIANNSVDLGNNTGWIINQAAPQNYYWIANGGNWNDPAHWSLTSGGLAGDCLPGINDDVIFDQNSFTQDSQQVIINVSEVFCKNMDWSQVNYYPELTSDHAANILNVSGSFFFSSAMKNSFQGEVRFNSQADSNIISTQSIPFLNNITFSSTGNWYLGSNLIVKEGINFYGGFFSTQNYSLKCKDLYNRNINNAYSKIDFTSSNIYISNRFYVDIPKNEFNTGTSTIFMDGAGTYFGCAGNEIFNRVIFTDTTNSLAYLGNNGYFKYLSFSTNVLMDGSNLFDTLIFNSGFNYIISGDQTINDYLQIHGECDRVTYITGGVNTYPARLIVDSGTVQAEYMILENIEAMGGATFIATQSVDLGGNPGWTIDPLMPRNLFWVNNQGEWEDPAHWSLLSGGPGGECIPTPVDNVYIDHNSFNSSNQSIILKSLKNYCKSFTCQYALYSPKLTGVGLTNSRFNLKIFGSLLIDSTLAITSNIDFDFSSADTLNYINALISFDNTFIFSGLTGSWKFESDIQTSNIYLKNGNLNTNSFNLRCIGMVLSYNRNLIKIPKLELYDSQLFIGGNGFTIWDSLIFLCGNSTIYLGGILQGNNNTFNNVIFNSDNHLPFLEGENNYFSYLNFQGNGWINGSNNYDTLSLFPGNTYHIKSFSTQTINHQLNIRGNNCFPISIKSSQPGNLASLSKPDGEVSGDFLELQDIQATGGASFFAGNFSTDLGNNPGWNWGNAPGYVFGFPTDTTICQGDTLNLSTDNFNGGTAWLWQDGSTNPDLLISEPGTYSCSITYAENCFIKDSILVHVNELPQMLAFPSSQLICSGDTAAVSLQNTNNVPGTYYSWEVSLIAGDSTSGFSAGSGDSIAQTLHNNGSDQATLLYTITPFNMSCPGSPVQASVAVKAHGSSITGSLLYDNPVNSPLSCSKIYLKNISGITVDSAATDQQGNYRFCDIPNGSYKLVVDTTKPWDGVNVTDGLMIIRHFACLDTLQNLRLRAADTDSTSYINSLDAQMVARRFVGLIDKYNITDWIFEEPEINITQISDLTLDIHGICSGDVNGSNLPPGCGK